MNAADVVLLVALATVSFTAGGNHINRIDECLTSKAAVLLGAPRFRVR